MLKNNLTSEERKNRHKWDKPSVKKIPLPKRQDKLILCKCKWSKYYSSTFGPISIANTFFTPSLHTIKVVVKNTIAFPLYIRHFLGTLHTRTIISLKCCRHTNTPSLQSIVALIGRARHTVPIFHHCLIHTSTAKSIFIENLIFSTFDALVEDLDVPGYALAGRNHVLGDFYLILGAEMVRNVAAALDKSIRILTHTISITPHPIISLTQTVAKTIEVFPLLAFRAVMDSCSLTV